MYKRISTIFLCLFLMCGLFYIEPVLAMEQKTASNYDELKLAVEQGGEKEITVTGDIVFKDQITVPEGSNIVIKDDGKKRRLIYGPDMVVESSSRYGKGLFFVGKNATLTIDGSSNDNLVFDGNRNNITANMEVTDNGVFLTVSGDGASVKINHGSFLNSKNRGMKTAPILVKDKGRLVVNDVLIKDNLFNGNQTTANYKYRDWDNNTQTIWSAKGSAIAVQSGAEVVFNNGIVENNGIIGDAAAFSDANISTEVPDHNAEVSPITLFGQNTKVTINGGTFRNNSAGIGGVLSAWNGAEANINGGVFTDNRSISYGGVCYAASSFYNVESGTPVLNNGDVVSKINITGGKFSGNKAYKNGGGAVFGDWNSLTNISSGIFENNSAPNGGAVVISDRWREGTGDDGGSRVYSIAQAAGYKDYNKWLWRAKASISGATFRGNSASLTGGALYINSSDVSLTSGTFDGNSSARYGGAIYLSSAPHVLKINNAYFENNRAENTDFENIVWDHENQQVNLYNGAGGALWYCPTGNTEFYVSNSAGFDNNSAFRSGDEYSSVTKLKKDNAENSSDPDLKGKDFKVTISDRMLGGGKINWYKDGSAISSNGERYKEGDEPISSIKEESKDIAIKGISSDDAKKAAKINASIFFSNNKSARGGAVATNGTVIIGDKEKEFNLKVVKEWDKSLENVRDDKDTSVEIELYNVTDESNRILIDKVTLNKVNGYEAVFKNLPLEANSHKIKYEVVEKGDKYNVTYDNKIVDTADVNNGQEVKTTIINGKKDEPPTEPDKPNPDKPEKPEIHKPDKPVKDKNNKPPTDNHAPNTGDPGMELYMGMGILCLVSINVLFMNRKRKNG